MAVLTTNKQIASAVKGSSARLQNELAATEVRYRPSLDVFVLSLTDGTRRVLQREMLEGLEHGTRKQLANVELVGRGSGLHWPDLDADLLVEPLVNGTYGSRNWMAQIGRRGGSISSKPKAKAARLNGQKGGRPRGKKAFVA